MEEKKICRRCTSNPCYCPDETTDSKSASVTGYEALVGFAKWCVNNWVCDGWDEAVGYTEEFCNSSQCRRCSARRILDKVAS